jgi:hypothetical protein
MCIGSVEVCEDNATESGKTGGGRARWVIRRGGRLLAGTNVPKTLLADPPSMARLVATPTLDGGAVVERMRG